VPETLKFMLVASVLLVFLMSTVALNVWVIRRNRRIAVDEPERVPRGRRLAMRALPFGLLLGAEAIIGIVTGNHVFTILGLLGFGCFGWIFFKGMTDRDYRT
jgi:hypothetical protein